MPYTPVNWVDNVTPLNAANMNHIEAGIAALGSGPGAGLLRQVLGADAHIEFGIAFAAYDSEDPHIAFTEAFTTPPVVVCNFQDPVPGWPVPTSISTTGFTITHHAIAPMSAGSFGCHWIAVGAG